MIPAVVANSHLTMLNLAAEELVSSPLSLELLAKVLRAVIEAIAGILMSMGGL